MKPRKLTKRQILNALLGAEEAQNKIGASQTRLRQRHAKLMALKGDLSKQLSNVLYDERVKSGNCDADQPPIVFKQHVFEISSDYLYGSERFECEVTKVNNVS